jgi:hypothetical protein
MTPLELAVVANVIQSSVELGRHRNAIDTTQDVYNGICEAAEIVRQMRRMRADADARQAGALHEYEEAEIDEILAAVTAPRNPRKGARTRSAR